MNEAIDIHRRLLASLPGPELDDLRKLAVPRFVTRDLLGVLDCRVDVEDVPFMKRATWDITGNTFVLDADVRAALLETWLETAYPTEIPSALSELNAAIARFLGARNEDRDALYHRLCVRDQRDGALAELERQFDRLLDATVPDVGRAHDLLRLLDEWPVFDPAQRGKTRERLHAKLARRSLWAREREATEVHLARPFEAEAWTALKDGPQWILHIHAPGGAGKTMLVRNLLGRSVPAEEIAAARVDFDHVAHLVTASNQPWRLLLLIARQLSRQLPGDPFSTLLLSWGRFATALVPSPGTATPPEPADSEEVRGAAEVPRLFRAILSECTGLSIVVLDTLENLLHTDATTLTGIVDELVAVHQECPRFRVILSGRFDIADTHRTRWGHEHTETVERIAGFRASLVGPPDEEVVRGPLRFGRQVITLAIPPFSDGDAATYLTERRGFATPGDDRVVATVDKCGGNPLKLAMLADVLTGDNPPTADEIRALESTELFYLADRVLDRITDPGVQWLLRWGVIPRVLSRDFAERVLWPRLEEHARTQAWDRPEEDALGKTGRGAERYTIAPDSLEFAPAWRRLTSYAASSSWVSPVAELPDTVAFHPEIRDPIRGLLRRHEQAIYHELNRAAVVYWEEIARTSQGIVRESALRSVLFHAFEPYRDRQAGPVEVWTALLATAGEDVALRAALAREVLDIDRRAHRADREQLPLVHTDLLAAAHTELAQEALVRIRAGHRGLLELRRYLEHSSLSPGMRKAVEARALFAVGNTEVAIRLLSEAAIAGGLDDDTGRWVTVELAKARRETHALERAAADTAGTPVWPGIAAALAELYLLRDNASAAMALYVQLDDRVGVARCEIAMAEYDLALTSLDSAAGEDAIRLRSEALLAKLEPDAVLALLERRESTFPVLAARAHAMLDRADAAVSHLESLHHRLERTDMETWLIAARTCLDLERPELAWRFLLEPLRTGVLDIAARAKLLNIESRVRMGDIDRAALELADLERADPAPDHSLAVRAAARIARLQIHGVHPDDLERLRDLLREGRSARHRLSLLVGLSRVAADSLPVPARLVDELEQLTRIDAGDAARLVLARAELLRVIGLHRDAAALLHRIAAAGSAVVRRHAERALDHVEGMPAMGHKSHVETYRDAGTQERPVASRRVLDLITPLTDIWRRESGVGPFRDDATYLLPKRWREECDWLGQALASEAAYDRPLVLDGGDEQHAWIPWQLATVKGVGIVAALELDHMRRADAPRPDGPAHLVGGVSIVSKGDGRTEEYVRQVRLQWSRFQPRVATGVEWQEWASLFVPATVVYIVAHLEQRKNGSVVLDLCTSPDGCTSAGQLGRAIKSVEQPPPLIVLDVPWPGGEATATKQLLLRERFAWELRREAPDVTLLALGFRDEDLHDATSVIVEGVARGRPLRAIVGDLQRAGASADSYAKHLARRGTMLYSNSTEAVVIEPRAAPSTETRATASAAPAVAIRDVAARRALVIGCQVAALKGVDSDAEALADLLGARGFAIDQRIGTSATRDGILEGCRALIASTDADDAAVIYYAGHGAHAVNALAAPGERSRFQCLVPTDWDHAGEFRGILDVELFAVLAELTARTRNVTMILDCCHAAELSRLPSDSDLVTRSLPGARIQGFPEFLAKHRIDVAPAIAETTRHAVRLTATQPDRPAFERRMAIGDRQVTRGIFSHALECAVKEAGDAPLSWQTIERRVLELVLEQARNQQPWVEGPADRCMFTTRIAKRADAVVYFEDNGQPALRAGRILGAHVGAVYNVLPLGELASERSAITTRATVTRLSGPNAHVTLDGPRPAAGALAYPSKLPYPSIAVYAQDPALRGVLASSALIELVDDPATARFTVTNDAGQLCMFEGKQLAATPTPDDADGRALLVERLERWSKAEALRALGTTDLPRDAVEVTWGRVDPKPGSGTRIEHAGNARLHVGELVYVTVRNRSSRTLFVGIFDVGVAGKVTLLTVQHPDGRKLEPGASFTLGVRDGKLQGLGPLIWPDDVPADSERRESLIVISSGHRTEFSLLQTPALRTRSSGLNRLEAALDSFRTATTRIAPTEHEDGGPGFHVQRIDFDLSPTRRTAFVIDQALDIRALDHALTALPPGMSSSPVSRIAVRLDEVALLANQILWSTSRIRIDTLALTAAGDSALRARTEVFPPISDGHRRPIRNLLLYEGPVGRFLDIAIWISRDEGHARTLQALIDGATRDPELQAAIATVRRLAASASGAQPATGVAASVATIVTFAGKALEATLGNAIGLYRTSFLPHEQFGLGRHPAHGAVRAQDFSFAYTVDPA